MPSEQPLTPRLTDEQLNQLADQILERVPILRSVQGKEINQKSILDFCDNEPVVGALANLVTVAVEKRVVQSQKIIMWIFVAVGIIATVFGINSFREIGALYQDTKVRWDEEISGLEGSLDYEIGKAIGDKLKEAEGNLKKMEMQYQVMSEEADRNLKMAKSSQDKLNETTKKTDEFFNSKQGNTVKILAGFNSLLESPDGNLLIQLTEDIAKNNKDVSDFKELLKLHDGKIELNGDVRVRGRLELTSDAAKVGDSILLDPKSSQITAKSFQLPNNRGSLSVDSQNGGVLEVQSASAEHSFVAYAHDDETELRRKRPGAPTQIMTFSKQQQNQKWRN